MAHGSYSSGVNAVSGAAAMNRSGTSGGWKAAVGRSAMPSGEAPGALARRYPPIKVKGFLSEERRLVPHEYRNNMQGKEFWDRCNLDGLSHLDPIHSF